MIRCLHSEDEQQYCDAIKTLDSLGPVAATAAGELIRFLVDNDVGLCITAIRAMGNMGPGAHTVLPELQKRANHPDPLIRKCAADAIEKFGTADTAPG